MCTPNDSLVIRSSCLYFVIMDKDVTHPMQSRAGLGGFNAYTCFVALLPDSICFLGFCLFIILFVRVLGFFCVLFPF